MTDYLIVGCGLAGIAFAETALQHGSTIFVFDQGIHSASKVAGGLYNPVILKRFSKVWKAKEQLGLLSPFYESVERRVGTQVYFPMPILRKFFSIEEQNNWFAASDKPELSDFMSLKLRSEKIPGIDSPYDYGEVLGTGYVDTALLLERYQAYLREARCLESGKFDYNALECYEDHIAYKGIKARQLVFAEGFGLRENPFFSYLPLDGTKGELLVIKAPELQLDKIVNTNVFILPLGDGLFKVGATYNQSDKTYDPTPEGKAELLNRLAEILDCHFEVHDHFAGIRPTVKDRRPLIGSHPKIPRLHILNGLGSRGVMMGPSMAKMLMEHLESGAPIDPEADIKRYERKFFREGV